MQAHLVFAEAAPGGSAALIASVAALLVAAPPLINALRRRRTLPSEAPDDVTAARAELEQRIGVLKDTVNDLTENLRQCRQERQLMMSEAMLTTMQVGQMEERLAACRTELRDARAELARGGES